MKTLVVYYSRTGNTKKVAEIIANKLEADIDEIIDTKERKGFIGAITSLKDSFGAETDIAFKKDPSKYDLVIIGTPIWMYTITPAVKAYLKRKFKKVAFFCTCNSDRRIDAFKDMEKLVGRPIATLIVEKGKGDINSFVKKVSSC